MLTKPRQARSRQTVLSSPKLSAREYSSGGDSYPIPPSSRPSTLSAPIAGNPIRCWSVSCWGRVGMQVAVATLLFILLLTPDAHHSHLITIHLPTSVRGKGRDYCLSASAPVWEAVLKVINSPVAFQESAYILCASCFSAHRHLLVQRLF